MLEPALISVADACRMLGIGKSLLYEMAADGRLGPMAISFGKKRLYRVAELRRWTEAGCPPRVQWVRIQARQPAEQTGTPHRFYKQNRRKGKSALRTTESAWVKIRPPSREEAITLVICRRVDRDTAFMLLTNLLCVLVMIYLVWIVELHAAMAERLIRLSHPLSDNPEFLAYLLFTGLTEAINAYFRLYRDMLRQSLRQNHEV